MQGHITEHHKPPLKKNMSERFPLVIIPPTIQAAAATENANNIFAEFSIEK